MILIAMGAPAPEPKSRCHSPDEPRPSGVTQAPSRQADISTEILSPSESRTPGSNISIDTHEASDCRCGIAWKCPMYYIAHSGRRAFGPQEKGRPPRLVQRTGVKSEIK